MNKLQRHWVGCDINHECYIVKTNNDKVDMDERSEKPVNPLYLEENTVVLTSDVILLEERVAYLESCICDTCHDPECPDSALDYYVKETIRYKKENEELKSLVNASMGAQKAVRSFIESQKPLDADLAEALRKIPLEDIML